MLASLAAGTGRGAGGGGAGGSMRELEAEAPVVWPAWCYSAESGVVSGGDRARAAAAAAARRCVRDPPPLPRQPPSPQQLPLAAAVKNERLSPQQNDNRSSISRSRSVTPSSSSYPGTPPERDSSPAAPVAVAPARNYSDIMRSLAARYNHQAAGVATAHSDFFHPARANGFPAIDARLGLAKVAGTLLAPTGNLASSVCASTLSGSIPTPPPARVSPVCPDSDQLVGGLFATFPSGSLQQRVPAFPVMVDMGSTKALLALAKVARSSGASVNRSARLRRSKRTVGAPEHIPLDLSASAELAKRARRESASSGSRASSPRGVGINSRVGSPRDHEERRSDTESRDERSGDGGGCDSGGGSGPRVCECAGGECERLAAWTVDDVCDFVQSIDICAEYAPNFREQRIDGSGLPLLTEEHLTGMLQMKLGPALKLQAMLRKRLSSCQHCVSPARLNGAIKSEPTSHINSPS